MRLWRVLRTRRFAFLWAGMTISSLGDEMSLVTFIWLTYQRTHSAAALSGIVIAYTAPLWLGGFLAGAILDRYPRRAALIVDNTIRGLTFAAIALAGLTHHFAPWMLYVGAAVYGFLRMISLAGVPAMIPSLVADDELGSANALESLAFQVAAVVGPAAGGLLLAAVGGFVAIAFDAASYFIFVACLLGVPPLAHEVRAPRAQPVRLSAAFRFIAGVPAMLAITIMFMCFNTAEGALTVLLPVYTTTVLHAGAALYGLLLTVNAVGATVATVIVGSIAVPRLLGRNIAAFQIAAGVAVAVLIAGSGALVYPIYFLVGVFTGPLTVWAQTLRMQLIPPELRGRVFALLRTFMQSTPPLGAAIAGVALGHAGIVPLIALLSATIAIPAAVAFATPVFRPAERLAGA